MKNCPSALWAAAYWSTVGAAAEDEGDELFTFVIVSVCRPAPSELS